MIHRQKHVYVCLVVLFVALCRYPKIARPSYCNRNHARNSHRQIPSGRGRRSKSSPSSRPLAFTRTTTTSDTGNFDSISSSGTLSGQVTKKGFLGGGNHRVARWPIGYSEHNAEPR